MLAADIFWLKPGSWREVHTTLDYHMRRYLDDNPALVSLAEAIAGNFLAVDPVMEQLCAATCPSCPQPCCLHADVRYDFKDLVFLHCRQEGLPVHQPKLYQDQPCSFLTLFGCAVPRPLRPFLCTWYLCPRQVEILDDVFPLNPGHFFRRLHKIQQLRKELEAAFIHLITP